MIDISGLDKAEVLAALYNRAKPQGMGFLQYVPGDMLTTDAQRLVAEHTYFDYLGGRVMKVDLSKDTLDPYLYDRDNGQGAAQAVIDKIPKEAPDERP